MKFGIPKGVKDRFIVFDVETPNYKNDRISSIGITVVEKGEIVDELYSLINPETYFHNFNINLTGITPKMVANQPVFSEIWPKIESIMGDGILVAHNATFDMGVLAKCIRHYGISCVDYVQYACTCIIGRACYPNLQNHKLNTLCDYLGIDLDHHNAASDSRACAGLLIDYMNKGIKIADYLRKYNFVQTPKSNEYVKFKKSPKSFKEVKKDIKVALISCTKYKGKTPSEAMNLYNTSPLFKKSLAYARTISGDIYVISAKHGLLELDEVIEPYNETLKDKSQQQLLAWGNQVAEQLKNRYNLQNTEFVILAGKNYYHPLKSHLPHMHLPLEGLRYGDCLMELDRLIRLHSLKDTINYRLHELFNGMDRFQCSTIDDIPFDDGIYIVFENGEKYEGFDRIVRVGTHRSAGRLKSRLKDHFLKKDKNGSIFRKNIGRAILNKNNHPYLHIWNFDTRRSGPLARLAGSYDPQFEKKVEKKISQYMCQHFSFVIFPVLTKDERLRLEEGIIATLNAASDFIASPGWRGKYSPEEEIRQSGMWLKEGLNGVALSEKEFTKIKTYCQSSRGNLVKKHGQQLRKKTHVELESSGSIDEHELRRNWQSICSTFTNEKTELHTIPKSVKRIPVWFSVQGDGSILYISTASVNSPSSKLSGIRRLDFNEFARMYPIYIRRKKGEKVSREAQAASLNQVYWYAIMDYCGL